MRTLLWLLIVAVVIAGAGTGVYFGVLRGEEEAPPVNTAPVADDQSVVTDEDTPVAITLNGSDADYNGADSFTFKVYDGSVDSNMATVSITVNPVNDAPVADDRSVVTDEDTPVAITLTGSDADGDPLTYSIVTSPAHGTLSGTAPNVTYTPDAYYSGSDSFTFKVYDGSFDSNMATVSITVRVPEARMTEYNNIVTAVAAMMADNGLTSIPNPVSDATATNDMTAFPDTTSAAGSADKLTEPSWPYADYTSGDKDGYLLYGHDITADGSPTTSLVHYTLSSTSTWYYTIDSAGNVTQWSDAAKTQQLNP